MRPMFMHAAVVIAVACLSACKTVSAESDAPAVLTMSTDASRAELSNVVRQALHQTNVTLADDALTQESELIVGPVQPRDAQGRYLNGRDLAKPKHFRLVLNGSKCMLVHVETKERWALHEAKCVGKAVGS